MSDDESEIGGGKGRRIQRRAARGSLKGKPKRRAFTAARRQRFLNHFAASCCARSAARAVGVSESCVDAWRKKCPQFNEGWKEALKLGYSRLEAEVLSAARRALAIRPRKDAKVRVGAMSAETALKVLDAYRRSQGRDLGTVWPHPYDVGGVRRRFEAKMKALGLLGKGCPECGYEGPSICEGPSKEVEGPSTASRSPSPGNPGEESADSPLE